MLSLSPSLLDNMYVRSMHIIIHTFKVFVLGHLPKGDGAGLLKLPTR